MLRKGGRGVRETGKKSQIKKTVTNKKKLLYIANKNKPGQK